MPPTDLAEPAAPSPAPARRGGVHPGLYVVFAVTAVVMLVGAVVATRAADAPVDDALWAGTEFVPAPDRPSFTLTDTSGRPYDFAAETGGELTLLFFGYTNCPDICPIHMATLAQARERIDVAANVVFVTTDPARDTPERVRSWLDGFDPTYVGLVGTEAEVAAAQEAMDVALAQPQAPNEDGYYTVSHASGMFVITPDDKVRLVYGFGTRQDDWVDDLPRIAGRADWSAGSAEGTP